MPNGNSCLPCLEDLLLASGKTSGLHFLKTIIGDNHGKK